MDDSNYTMKGPASFAHGPEMEGSLSVGDNVSAVVGQEEIKRDLHSRHINMIAIAGMIVRASSLRMAVLAETFVDR